MRLVRLHAWSMIACCLWHLSASTHQPVDSDITGPIPTTVDNITKGLCDVGAPPINIVELTIADAHAALLNGTLSCTQLITAHLQRIESYEQSTQLNAIIAINPTALEEASKLDAQLLLMMSPANSTTTTSILPPLFCIPLLIKDNIDLLGMPTTAGSVAFTDNYPLQTAHVITKMQQKGAIVVAKSNMGELAFFPSYCISSIKGAARNPYSLSYTTAGSSGGTAAGIAASYAIIGLGTDTGNSVRGPASHQSLVGLRPTIGLIGRSGIVPLRHDRDTVGPMTRTVTDAAIALNAMVGYDPLDNLTDISKTSMLLPVDYTSFLNASALVGARIGVLSEVLNLPDTDDGIKLLFSLALAALEQAGAVIVDPFTIKGNTYGSDWSATRNGKGPALGHWYINGGFEDLWACQSTLRDGINEYLLSTAGAISNNNSRSINSFQELYMSGKYHPLSQEDISSSLSAAYTADEYPPQSLQDLGYRCGCGVYFTDPCRTEFRKRFISSMQDIYKVDAVVYPTWLRKPLLIGDLGDGYYDGNLSPFIAPHVGAPAVTVPMGYTSDGILPVGLQFIGLPFEEGKLLGLAYAYEQATKHRQPPSLFSECRALSDDGDTRTVAG